MAISIPHLIGCGYTLFPSAFSYSLVPTMLAEAILCFCMVSKAWSMQKQEQASPTMKQLVKDRSASMLVLPSPHCPNTWIVCFIFPGITKAVWQKYSSNICLNSIFAILIINSFLWNLAPHPLKFPAFGYVKSWLFFLKNFEAIRW